MDDLEKAILISFDESGAVGSVLKNKLQLLFSKLKRIHQYVVCVEKLHFSELVQVQFWCLLCLHEALCDKYSSMSPEEVSFIRKSVFSMACSETTHPNCNNSVSILEGPVFIKNKLAQVVVTLINIEYPQTWPSVFVDFFSHLNKGTNVIDMVCRMLNAMDDELISMVYPRNGNDVAVFGRIKNAMIAQCVSQLVAAWHDIISMYRN